MTKTQAIATLRELYQKTEPPSSKLTPKQRKAIERVLIYIGTVEHQLHRLTGRL